MGYITYTGDDKLYVHGMTFSTEEPLTGLTKFGVWLKPTTLSGGEEKIPSNMNATSALTSETTCIHNDVTTPLIISGGDSIYTIRISGSNSFTVNFNDAIILGRNQSIGIKGSAESAGTKTRVTIDWFEE